jgi:hypothetical protein
MRLLPTSMALILLSLGTITFADPLQWTPPAQMPALRERLHGPKYAARLASASEKIDSNIGQDHPPATGIRVIGVDKNSQASAADIRVGDVIISADGDPLYSVEQYLADRDGGANTLKIWRPHSPPDQSRRKITFNTGEIGITLEHFWRPDVVYHNELSDGARPDPLILAAATVLQSDPELAETALLHAQQAGGDKQEINFLAAAIATSEARFDDAMAFANQAIDHAAPDDKPIVADFLHTAALASFHLKYALDLEKSYAFLKPPASSDDKGILEKTIRQLGDIPDWPDSPADEFAKLATQDMTKKISAMAVGDEKGAGTGQAAADIRASDRVSFDCPGDTYETFSYNLFVLGPTGHNVKFYGQCHFQSAEKKMTQWERCVRFGIAPRGSTAFECLSVVITDAGAVHVHGPWNPECSCDLGPAIIKGFNVTMIAVGQRCEIDVNNNRVFYGPILAPTETRQLRLVFEAAGVKGALTNVVWKIDKPDPTQ